MNRVSLQTGFPELPCRVRVADGGLLVDAEDESEVERVKPRV
jgi:hypothetical protein